MEGFYVYSAIEDTAGCAELSVYIVRGDESMQRPRAALSALESYHEGYYISHEVARAAACLALAGLQPYFEAGPTDVSFSIVDETTATPGEIVPDSESNDALDGFNEGKAAAADGASGPVNPEVMRGAGLSEAWINGYAIGLDW